MAIPKLCKSKEYNHDWLGGYLLYDVICVNDLIIKNNIYLKQSWIKDKNITYSVVNSLANCPYKVNVRGLYN